jgi:hypothetical protein
VAKIGARLKETYHLEKKLGLKSGAVKKAFIATSKLRQKCELMWHCCFFLALALEQSPEQISSQRIKKTGAIEERNAAQKGSLHVSDMTDSLVAWKQDKNWFPFSLRLVIQEKPAALRI